MMPFQSNNLNPVNQQTLVGQYIFICKIKYVAESLIYYIRSVLDTVQITLFHIYFI